MTNKIYFPEFKDLSAPKGKNIKSNEFVCLGSEWSVLAYPHGFDDVQVHVFLIHLSSNKTLKVEVMVAVNDRTLELQPKEETHEFSTFTHTVCVYRSGREDVLAGLIDGTLVVEVRMRLANTTRPFVPVNPSACKTIQKMFMDEEYADIMFEIGGGVLGSTLSLFHAHRLVLTMAAPQLEELCMKSDDNTRSCIRIRDVSPDSF